VADKAYDADAFLQSIACSGAATVIPPREPVSNFVFVSHTMFKREHSNGDQREED
jgi:transposase